MMSRFSNLLSRQLGIGCDFLESDRNFYLKNLGREWENFDSKDESRVGVRDRFCLTSSGVARVPCTLGQEVFLRPLSAKTTEFKVKKLGAKI